MAEFSILWKGRGKILDELALLLTNASGAAPHANFSTVRIQRLFRGYFIRSHVSVMRVAAVEIARVYRGHVARCIARNEGEKKSQLEEIGVHHYHAIMLQRSYRGYYSRLYKHNFSARKQYLDSIAEKGVALRARLAKHQEALIRADAEAAEQKAQDEFKMVTENLHHLVSTKSIPGVYKSPYLDEPTAMGRPLEEHLRTGVKAILQTRGYTKRGLTRNIGGGRVVPIKAPVSKRSLQATSHYDAVTEAERLEKRRTKIGFMDKTKGFEAGHKVPLPAHRRGLNEGSAYQDPWKNPYLTRGVPEPKADLQMGRSTLGKAPAVHFYTAVGGNKSAALPNGTFDAILDAEHTGGVHLRHKHRSLRFGVPDTCDVHSEDPKFPPLVLPSVKTSTRMRSQQDNTYGNFASTGTKQFSQSESVGRYSTSR